MMSIGEVKHYRFNSILYKYSFFEKVMSFTLLLLSEETNLLFVTYIYFNLYTFYFPIIYRHNGLIISKYLMLTVCSF